MRCPVVVRRCPRAGTEENEAWAVVGGASEITAAAPVKANSRRGDLGLRESNEEVFVPNETKLV